MSAQRRKHLGDGASSVALGAIALGGPDLGDAAAGAESDFLPAAAARMIADADMGDSASKAALTRLNTAVAELKAMSVQPLLNRAIAAIGAEDHQTASDLALKALAQDERNGVAWYLLAIAREKASDFKNSINAYEAALALTPNHAEIANDLGRLAYRLGLKEVAAQLFQHYCAAHPDCAQGANNLACALRDLNRYEDAIGVIRPAILAHPTSAALWNTLGTIVGEQGDVMSALTFFDEALTQEADFVKARYNRANIKLDIGDDKGALADVDAAIPHAATPSDRVMMRLARSTMLLCDGRIGEGWDEYEVRLDPDFSDVTHFMIDRPRWTPESDLTGKSLLLMGEQGLGDEVLFAGMIPDILRDMGPEGRLSLAVEPRLISLFERSFPGVDVGAHATYKVDGYTVRGAPFIQDRSTLDLWTPLGSPLRKYRRTLEAFPKRDSYLTADPSRIAHWRRILAERPGLKVGVLWKSLKLSGSRLRYFSPFDQWRPVLETPGVSFVNLQYGDCAAELAEARDTLGLEIWQPPEIDLKNDLDDVAALCCALDVTIGPANATTNIGAACGASTWLISTLACWPRLGSSYYPWYPQMRVFIPETVGEWAPMMNEAAAALRERASAKA
jgi:tetratricopeptide (TPR) repeat protein